MGLYGERWKETNLSVELTESEKKTYNEIFDFVSEQYNEDQEVVQELTVKKDRENLESTDYDYKNLKIEDINTEAKFKRVCLALQQEDDKKMQKFAVNILIRHIISMLLMPAFGIGFILAILNIFLSMKLESELGATSWERIAKRLEKRKEKETDPKEIKKLEKMIDKLYDKAADARDSQITATIKK